MARKLSFEVGAPAALSTAVADAAQLAQEDAVALICAGAVFVDGRRVKDLRRRLNPGARLTVHLQLPEAPPEIPTLFEDADIKLVNKPAGVHVNETETRAAPSLIASLGSGLQLVHRLDRDTSGLLLLAKNPQAARALSERFASRRVHKIYYAAVTRPVEAQRVAAPIGKDHRRPRARAIRPGGKPAQTELEPLSQRSGLGLVRAEPRTGRTHQIRLHLAHVGAPIFGDLLYGGVAATRVDGEILRAERVMLHAAALRIEGWPGQAEFSCPWPADFEALFGVMPD